MLWKFNQVYNVDRLVRDHEGIVRYPMGLPAPWRRPSQCEAVGGGVCAFTVREQ